MTLIIISSSILIVLLANSINFFTKRKLLDNTKITLLDYNEIFVRCIVLGEDPSIIIEQKELYIAKILKKEYNERLENKNERDIFPIITKISPRKGSLPKNKKNYSYLNTIRNN